MRTADEYADWFMFQALGPDGPRENAKNLARKILNDAHQERDLLAEFVSAIELHAVGGIKVTATKLLDELGCRKDVKIG